MTEIFHCKNSECRSLNVNKNLKNVWKTAQLMLLSISSVATFQLVTPQH